MRIFLSSLLISAHLLCLFLPATGATPHGSGADTSAQVNHAVAEGSGDTIKAGAWASFPSPSYIIEDIQNTIPPIGSSHDGCTPGFCGAEPSPSDFWERAKEYEKLLQDYVPNLLRDAAAHFKSNRFTDVSSDMHHIVNATATFRDNIKGALDAHGITIDKLTDELEGIFMGIVNDLEKIPAPEKAPGHAERLEMVDMVLDDTVLAFISLATRYGIEEEVVKTYLFALRPHVQALTVAVGDINEQHPDLLPLLAFSVAALLIPESWILRPFLSVFGFGPTGPVKGSTAARLQRRFWGAAVEAGSWFSLLQQAGMGVYPGWVGLAPKVPLLVVGLLVLLLCCRR